MNSPLRNRGEEVRKFCSAHSLIVTPHSVAVAWRCVRVPSLSKHARLETVDKSGVGRKGRERTVGENSCFPTQSTARAARKGTAIGSRWRAR
ncbi:hypothetical protein NPIL_368171 [Nephila pilipes]|uniref:Uncharacterized protein n=1 Tax=Nephila pilipes TaxID=299642 RepID=A0A8X6R2U5_NEPPI|nr:hypothetical protein NPIL_368171 [Nephila pilipes]